jgi:hypothetical protein
MARFGRLVAASVSDDCAMKFVTRFAAVSMIHSDARIATVRPVHVELTDLPIHHCASRTAIGPTPSELSLAPGPV